MTNTPSERLGYALGVSIGSSLLSQHLTDFEHASFIQGLNDIIKSSELKIPGDELNGIIQGATADAREKVFAKNKTQGEAYLAANGERDDVTVLDSGLQYEVLTSGSGKSPGLTDQVTTHYHGTLIDGTVFDSSVERGEPAAFGVNQVIKGWTEALQLMKEGDKWRLFVPQHLAYGPNPRPGGPIEPYATLIFDVELLSV